MGDEPASEALAVFAARIVRAQAAIRDRLGTTDDPLGADQATSLAYVDLAIELEALRALIEDASQATSLFPSAILFAEAVFARAHSLHLCDALEVSTAGEHRAMIAARMEAP